MTNIGVTYDRRNGEIVILWKLNFAENYEERYPIADVVQVALPFEHQGGWTFKITLRDRNRAPLIALRKVRKFVLFPMTNGACYDLFNAITDAYSKLRPQTIN